MNQCGTSSTYSTGQRSATTFSPSINKQDANIRKGLDPTLTSGLTFLVQSRNVQSTNTSKWHLLIHNSKYKLFISSVCPQRLGRNPSASLNQRKKFGIPSSLNPFDSILFVVQHKRYNQVTSLCCPEIRHSINNLAKSIGRQTLWWRTALTMQCLRNKCNYQATRAFSFSSNSPKI